MATLTAELDARAFETSLEMRGEDATLRRADGSDLAVRVLINRPGPPPAFTVAADGDEKTGAVIQFLKTVPKPAAGEVVVESSGNRHRINEVADYGHCWNTKTTSRNAR